MPDHSHLPIIVHHMAALDGRAAPPNTLEAIQACLEAHAPVIEIDVSALAGDDYLLVHDLTLDGETTGSGRVDACTVEQARQLRVRVHGQATRYRVPLLGDVVRLFQDHGLSNSQLQIDYKNVFPMPNTEPLQRLIRLIAPLSDRVIVSSVADWQLRKLRALAPSLALGFDIQLYLDWYAPGDSPDPEAYPRRLGAYGYWDDHMLATQRIWTAAEYLEDRCAALLGLVPRVSAFYVRHELLAHSLDDGFNWANALHQAGVQLDAWTLDVGRTLSETNARRLHAAGVDQFTTNTPVALATLLAA